ncbi:UbiX family flavin prenyltransferase [Devosia sp. XJ19-1]|uniref:Flavin prenyltransferase UbiX n=1 Tax=Devosia ureilytica TaxID=2952754 RepID=A0A9Q4AR29_9HYPH|nr:UbiX family flavin prenyltransferase [Devosia ureilytica]MCP8884485.1 UbiX family flavin prenyltransferase [Devosia ureilytica]MCP8888093.1 UbiX family flavin prenyltransferase [Devosia ureilytica]
MNRIVLAVTGASGAALALRIAERLQGRGDVEIELVVSAAAERTLSHEVGPDALTRLVGMASHVHAVGDIGATIASGSHRTKGMIVAPCSMRTLAAIATGITDNLVTRAADVQLKERRRLVLLARETPLHLGHLRNMTAVTEMGAIVMPPVPAFYHRPQSVAEIVDHLAARAIDLLDLPGAAEARPWRGEEDGGAIALR